MSIEQLLQSEMNPLQTSQGVLDIYRKNFEAGMGIEYLTDQLKRIEDALHGNISDEFKQLPTAELQKLHDDLKSFITTNDHADAA